MRDVLQSDMLWSKRQASGCCAVPCRLVWSRIWAVLADFFVEVGCHPNLQVYMI